MTGFQVIVEDITEENLLRTFKSCSYRKRSPYCRRIASQSKKQYADHYFAYQYGRYTTAMTSDDGNARYTVRRVMTWPSYMKTFIWRKIFPNKFWNLPKKVSQQYSKYVFRPNGLSLKFNVSDVFLDLDTAIPCGLYSE